MSLKKIYTDTIVFPSPHHVDDQQRIAKTQAVCSVHMHVNFF